MTIRVSNARRWAANEGSQNVSRHLREGLERDVQSPLRR